MHIWVCINSEMHKFMLTLLDNGMTASDIATARSRRCSEEQMTMNRKPLACMRETQKSFDDLWEHYMDPRRAGVWWDP